MELTEKIKNRVSKYFVNFDKSEKAESHAIAVYTSFYSCGENAEGDVYSPFGEPLNCEDTAAEYIRFQGKLWFPDVQLYYWANRWYDPHIGQFITPDPMGVAYNIEDPFTYNPYCFVNNNPWRYRDPTGEEVNWIQTLTGGLRTTGGALKSIGGYKLFIVGASGTLSGPLGWAAMGIGGLTALHGAADIYFGGSDMVYGIRGIDYNAVQEHFGKGGALIWDASGIALSFSSGYVAKIAQNALEVQKLKLLADAGKYSRGIETSQYFAEKVSSSSQYSVQYLLDRNTAYQAAKNILPKLNEQIAYIRTTKAILNSGGLLQTLNFLSTTYDIYSWSDNANDYFNIVLIKRTYNSYNKIKSITIINNKDFKLIINPLNNLFKKSNIPIINLSR